ncbi:hypothetical protein ACFE04_019273 [Oxalis oulophora]
MDAFKCFISWFIASLSTISLDTFSCVCHKATSLKANILLKFEIVFRLFGILLELPLVHVLAWSFPPYTSFVHVRATSFPAISLGVPTTWDEGEGGSRSIINDLKENHWLL